MNKNTLKIQTNFKVISAKIYDKQNNAKRYFFMNLVQKRGFHTHIHIFFISFVILKCDNLLHETTSTHLPPNNFIIYNV